MYGSEEDVDLLTSHDRDSEVQASIKLKQEVRIENLQYSDTYVLFNIVVDSKIVIRIKLENKIEQNPNMKYVLEMTKDEFIQELEKIHY